MLSKCLASTRQCHLGITDGSCQTLVLESMLRMPSPMVTQCCCCCCSAVPVCDLAGNPAVGNGFFANNFAASYDGIPRVVPAASG
jgi:hypothetical protein